MRGCPPPSKSNKSRWEGKCGAVRRGPARDGKAGGRAGKRQGQGVDESGGEERRGGGTQERRAGAGRRARQYLSSRSSSGAAPQGRQGGAGRAGLVREIRSRACATWRCVQRRRARPMQRPEAKHMQFMKKREAMRSATPDPQGWTADCCNAAARRPRLYYWPGCGRSRSRSRSRAAAATRRCCADDSQDLQSSNPADAARPRQRWRRPPATAHLLMKQTQRMCAPLPLPPPPPRRTSRTEPSRFAGGVSLMQG